MTGPTMTLPTLDRASARLAPTLLAALLALAVSAPAAQVFKCAGRNGIPVYQDGPCPAGKELRNFQTDPPAITVLPAPELALEPRPAGEAKRPVREPVPRRAATADGGEGSPAGDAAERRFLRPGMTEGEVVARVGVPEVTSRGGSRKSATRWTYLPSTRDPETITIVTLSNGVVTDVQRKVSK